MQQHSTKQYIKTFQGARFVFVLFIFFSHCVMTNFNTFEFGGECGVSFFFTLSGFVLSLGYGSKVLKNTFNHWRFFIRHFIRLYPLHLLLFVIVLILDTKAGIHYDAEQLLTNLLLLQSWVPSNNMLFTVNGVSWFLCNTLFFYFIFPYLYKEISKLRRQKLKANILFYTFAVLYIIFAKSMPINMVNCTLYANPLLRTPDFALGIVACQLFEQMKAKNDFMARLANAPLLFDLFIIIFTYFIYQHITPNFRCAALFWLFIPFLVIHLAYRDKSNDFIAQLLSSKVLLWLGNVSFEFFITHTLVLRLLRHFIANDGTPQHNAAFLILSLSITLAFATLLHNCFVKPIAKIVNK